MSNEKMRYALDAIKDHNDKFALLPESLKNLIDGALEAEPEEVYTPKQVQHLIRDAYQEGKNDHELRATSKIFELPEQIKEQAQKIADLAISTEKLRASTENSRMQALEIVVNLKEDDKQKYGNDKARRVAQERLLAEDKEYLDNCDALARQEFQLKTEQIELDYLHNLFRAYLAVAGMQGMRV